MVERKQPVGPTQEEQYADITQFDNPDLEARVASATDLTELTEGEIDQACSPGGGI